MQSQTSRINGGEPYAPGTRFEYTDEFVVGAEHQFRGGIVASARYIDRRLKRVIEDQGGISVEEYNSGGPAELLHRQSQREVGYLRQPQRAGVRRKWYLQR